MVPASSNINTLDFFALFDLSNVTPAITLSNNSTGPSLNLCTWWYEILTPGATYIHQGTQGTPDVVNANWTTLAVTNTWPQPFNQIQWSGTNYIVTLYVKDAAGQIYSVTKEMPIRRPLGNTVQMKWNFGSGKYTDECGKNINTLYVESRCADGKLYVEDKMNYSYEGNFGVNVSKKFVLDYPLDATGTRPDPYVVTGFNSALIPIAYGGDGFNLLYDCVMRYDFPNGLSIQIKYKTRECFPVYCDIDLCPLQCAFGNLIREVKEGRCADPDAESNLLLITSLMTQAMLCKVQPNCGIDLHEIIKEIKRLGKFECDCYATGVNTNTSSSSSTGNCCPITVPVYTHSTSVAPSTCPLSYFPASIYDPLDVAVIGIAQNVDDMIAIINGNVAWQAYGVAFNAGNCTVGFFPVSQTETIPPVHVSNTNNKNCNNNTQNYQVPVEDFCNPTVSVSNLVFPGNFYVSYDNGVTIIALGVQANVAALIAALNAEGSKPASVTYTNGNTSQFIGVNIYNANCTNFNNPITIYSDYAETQYLLYGASHQSVDTTPGDMYGFGIANSSVLGKLCGTSIRGWHTVRMGNELFISEGSSGKIYVIDITNPLNPTLSLTIQLPTIMGISNFAGTPQCGGVNQYHSLYFPTDYGGVSGGRGVFYVVEGLTGSIWAVNINGQVIASFQDNRFIGKCPRIVLNGKLYLTQDGNLEACTGQSSGVAAGKFVLLDLSTFNAGGITTPTLSAADGEYIMAAAYDGTRYIYFITGLKRLVKYDTTNATFVITAGAILSFNYTGMVNVRYYAGTLFISAYGVQTIAVTPQGTFGSLFALQNFAPLNPHQGAADNKAHYNFLPLPGSCIGLLTYENGTNRSGLAKYRLDGTFLGLIDMVDIGSLYNVVPAASIAVYTPNTLC